MNASQLQNHFDAFYEDFWCEMCKYGEVEEVVVCDNNNDRELLFFAPFGWFVDGAGVLYCWSRSGWHSCYADRRFVCEQISSATSTRASNTKILPNRPATRSTRAGTPPAPSTASSPP